MHIPKSTLRDLSVDKMTQLLKIQKSTKKICSALCSLKNNYIVGDIAVPNLLQIKH